MVHYYYYSSLEVSDDGEYIIVYTYEVINEELLYFASIKEPLMNGFKEKLQLTPLNTEPSSFSVSLPLPIPH